MASRPIDTFIETWQALAQHRRALPLLAVLLALLLGEWLATQSLQALALDAALFALFVLVLPALHRVLLPHARLGSLLYVAVGAALVLAFGAMVWALPGLDFTYVIEPGAMGMIVVLFLVGGWGLSRDLQLERRAEQSDLSARASALQAQAHALQAQGHALDAERSALLALRAQLDPHFLFNTLNAIAEWCREDPMIAEKATLELASMLRAMLDGARAPSWPLATELDLLRRLTALYEIRDRQRYRFRFEVAEPVPALKVPPMLLLPLLENAITHGPSAGHDGEVTVQLRETNQGVELTLLNPGAFKGRREGGQGIEMVEKRLLLAYGDRAQLVMNADGEHTRTHLRLPRAVEPEAA